MDSEEPTPSSSLATWQDDSESTPSTNLAESEAWLSSIKKKINDFERENLLPRIARVEIGNECDALREMVIRQQETIQNLSLELEEERSASSSAANETMSMMLRLQKDKAEIQLEFRQFKRYAEEKMAHDQHEISIMEDLLYKREMAIESLYSEVQAYRHRMKSYGLADFEIDGDKRGPLQRDNSADLFFDANNEIEVFNYPPLRCFNESSATKEDENDVIDIDKYAFGDTPRNRDQLKDLEQRINQLEKSPRPDFPDEENSFLDNAWERVIIGQSHNQPRHSRGISTDSPKSFIVRETGSDFEPPSFINNQIRGLRKGFNGSEIGDDMSEKVCTIDPGISYNGISDIVSRDNGEIEDREIKKLYMRLHALEADRESMRKTLNAMQTDKVQVVLLKEIAQHLCKEMPPAKRVPGKKPKRFSFLSVFTWMVTFVFWRTKPRRTKYMFGMSDRNAGLLMLVDKGPRVGRWRCLLSTQV